LHGRQWPQEPGRPSVWILDVSEPALILGSTQPADVVDASRADAEGVEVVRRRSGGGAVLLRPGSVVWVDVLVPPGDVLWTADVATAFHWLGRAWAGALGDLGVDASWHDGTTLVTSPWSRLVCFAGLGPGEVTSAGAKVVGVSQRRQRTGALFQCAALLAWEPSDLLGLMRLDDEERRRAAGDIRPRASALKVDGGRVEQAFLDRLARL
jgi:lipoate-protein ligase A